MKKLSLISILIADLFLCAVVYSVSVTENLSDNLLRMHIIANSDSKADQDIKLLVRNKIIKSKKNTDYRNKRQIVMNIGQLNGEINEYLKQINAGYDCKIEYCISDFPEKEYADISMPCGKYECIRAVLGEGKGKNWWCVAYPPLCFTENSLGAVSDEGNAALKNEISGEAYKIIKRKGVQYKIKFKTVDIINNLIAGIM